MFGAGQRKHLITALPFNIPLLKSLLKGSGSNGSKHYKALNISKTTVWKLLYFQAGGEFWVTIAATHSQKGEEGKNGRHKNSDEKRSYC